MRCAECIARRVCFVALDEILGRNVGQPHTIRIGEDGVHVGLPNSEVLMEQIQHHVMEAMNWKLKASAVQEGLIKLRGTV